MMQTGEIPISHPASAITIGIIDYSNRGVDTKVDTMRGEANRVETPFKNGKVINTKKDEPEKPACKLGLVYCDRRRHQCAFQLGL